MTFAPVDPNTPFGQTVMSSTMPGWLQLLQRLRQGRVGGAQPAAGGLPTFPTSMAAAAPSRAPGAGGGPAAAPPVAAAQGRRSILERIFPNPTDPIGGLLSPDQLSTARHRGLMSAGLAMMDASGNPETPGFLQQLSRGIQAGYGGYESSVNGIAQSTIAAQQLAAQVRKQQIREKIGGMLSGVKDPKERFERLQEMAAQALSVGDTDTLGALSQIINASKPDTAAKDDTEWVDEGGTKTLRNKKTGKPVYDPETGKPMVIAKTPGPRDPNAPNSAELLRQTRQFTLEDKLADDFNKDTKSQRETAAKISGAIAEAPRALAGDGASQINLLYTFVSAMDPNSAVREGEISLAQAATPVWDQARMLVQKYTSGQSVTLSPVMIKTMTDLMRRRYESYQRAVGERQKYYRGRGARVGVGADVFPGLDALPGGAAQAPGAPQGDAAKVSAILGVRR